MSIGKNAGSYPRLEDVAPQPGDRVRMQFARIGVLEHSTG